MHAKEENIQAAPYAKITAFVTRERDEKRELLVFRHPSAGVQLPAGSVELGEDPAAAALREVTEETGLTNIALNAFLGVRIYPLPDSGRILTRSVALLDSPDGVPPGNAFLRRGLTVHELERLGDYSRIEFREYEMRAGALEIAAVLASGWAASADLSASVERFFYHIQAHEATPDEWTWFAEDEHDFQCYWVPLSQDPGLVNGQDQWLAWFVDRLRDKHDPR